jgi:hypothetical protein
VFAELLRSSSCSSEYAEAGGEAESCSLVASSFPECEDCASLVFPIATKTDAASSSCTCWCFEMRSFDVSDHSGVCSQLWRGGVSSHRSTLQVGNRLAAETLPRRRLRFTTTVVGQSQD